MTGYVGAIEDLALRNTYFRQVLFTAKHAQLVVMCLQPGEEIGDEVHDDVDQFFRIERGEARFVFDEKEERLVHDGDGIVVPAKTYHNVINTSKTAPLKPTLRPTTRTERCTRPRRRRRRPRNPTPELS